MSSKYAIPWEAQPAQGCIFTTYMPKWDSSNAVEVHHHAFPCVSVFLPLLEMKLTMH